jgi:branched-chain amino acid transport system substrate-binding protein
VIGWSGAFGAGATTAEAIDYINSLGNVSVLPLEEQPIDPAADVTGLIQSCLLQGANVIYNQNLSFGVAQVVGTARALGVWDQAIYSGVNWTNNIDVINIMGENAQLMDGYYAMFPHLTWTDTDHPGIQQGRASFGRGGYPEGDRSNTYLLTYSTFYNIAATLRRVINEHGIEGLNGPNYLAALTDPEHCTDDALGYFPVNYCDGNRSGRMSQIRRATWMGDHIEYVVVEDFIELPDTKPPAP